MSHFSAACDDLRQNVLRLHIIANSDSEADQQLKLKIRDEILSKTDGMFLNSCDLETAQNTVFENLSLFEQIANNVIEENGFEYKAKASLGIGEGEGKNWWCVVYPTVCIPAAAKGELSDTVCEESAQIAKNEKRYVMRFKAVEIYEKIKKYINR